MYIHAADGSFFPDFLGSNQHMHHLYITHYEIDYIIYNVHSVVLQFGCILFY